MADSESRPFDSTQEIRAMILAALPYPPVPVMLRRFEDGNMLGAHVVQTSHEIISILLTDACAKNTVSDNKARQLRQQQVLRGFLEELVKNGLQTPPDLYRTICKFTQLHIATYLRGDGTSAQLPEIQFMPFDHVCKGDVVHRRTCDYMAAQARLLELQGGLCAQDWGWRDYIDMILVARERLVCVGRDEREINADDEQEEDCAREVKTTSKCSVEPLGHLEAVEGEAR